MQLPSKIQMVRGRAWAWPVSFPISRSNSFHCAPFWPRELLPNLFAVGMQHGGTCSAALGGGRPEHSLFGLLFKWPDWIRCLLNSSLRQCCHPCCSPGPSRPQGRAGLSQILHPGQISRSLCPVCRVAWTAGAPETALWPVEAPILPGKKQGTLDT